MCYSASQCVALQCVAVRCNVLLFVKLRVLPIRFEQCVAVCYSELQCAALRRSVLQCVEKVWFVGAIGTAYQVRAV